MFTGLSNYLVNQVPSENESLVPESSGKIPTLCPHDWKSGPFYVMVAVAYEEPDYYPPQGMIPVEHCTLCGLIRLSEAYRQEVGRNLR